MKKKDGLNRKDKKKIYYKKLRLTNDYQYEPEEEEQKQQTSKKPDKKEPPQKSTKDDLRKFKEWVNKKETGINSKLFKKYFNFQRPSDMLKFVYITNDRKKNNRLVIMIKSGSSDLRKEIENMSEKEKQIEKPNGIVDIAEKILEFNDQIQRGQGLKILTPGQMISRLPISLAQLKAGNNCEKRKNEIR